MRVTLELDREVPFYDERIDGPPRVFVDLQNTRAVDAAAGRRHSVRRTTSVRQVRVGRQPDARTRVVLDLKAPARYSVFTLYNPYRIVVDVERRPRAPRRAPSARRVAPRRADAGRAPPPRRSCRTRSRPLPVAPPRRSGSDRAPRPAADVVAAAP